MKRISSYLIIAALLLCIVVVALAIVWRSEAVAAANDLAVNVSSQALESWDADLIINNATQSLLDQGGDGFYHTYFASLQRLGALQEITGINMTVDLPALLLPTSSGSASYTMNAVFSNGQAEVRITLERHEGQWWFSEYLVLTPFLAS